MTEAGNDLPWAGKIVETPGVKSFLPLAFTASMSSAKIGRSGRRVNGRPFIARSPTKAAPESRTMLTDPREWPGGITHDGTRLIVSDGSSTIRFWDPNTLQEIGNITVRDDHGPVNRLNEVEYIDRETLANIWLTDLIARISPETRATC